MLSVMQRNLLMWTSWLTAGVSAAKRERDIDKTLEQTTHLRSLASTYKCLERRYGVFFGRGVRLQHHFWRPTCKDTQSHILPYSQNRQLRKPAFGSGTKLGTRLGSGDPTRGQFWAYRLRPKYIVTVN